MKHHNRIVHNWSLASCKEKYTQLSKKSAKTQYCDYAAQVTSQDQHNCRCKIGPVLFVLRKKLPDYRLQTTDSTPESDRLQAILTDEKNKLIKALAAFINLIYVIIAA